VAGGTALQTYNAKGRSSTTTKLNQSRYIMGVPEVRQKMECHLTILFHNSSTIKKDGSKKNAMFL
jgi:hypothetical protein